MVGHLTKLLLVSVFLSLPGVLLASEIEKKFSQAGLIDVNTVDRSIQVDLVNTDPDKNFFEENFYDGLNKAYLRKEIAVKLSNAQSALKNEHPGYSLQVLDAARPRSVSRAMHEKMKGSRFEKYVANPEKGSMHNYGIAVDITIIDESGNKLDMGPSPFYSSRTAIYWNFFLKNMGLGITSEQQNNLDLLKRVMLNAGFHPLAHEWWHFNGMEKTDARNMYSIIE